VLLGKGWVVGYGCDFGPVAAAEVRACMSGDAWGYCRVADVGTDPVGVATGEDMAWSSATPGWDIEPSGQIV